MIHSTTARTEIVYRACPLEKLARCSVITSSSSTESHGRISTVKCVLQFPPIDSQQGGTCHSHSHATYLLFPLRLDRASKRELEEDVNGVAVLSPWNGWTINLRAVPILLGSSLQMPPRTRSMGAIQIPNWNHSGAVD